MISSKKSGMNLVLYRCDIIVVFIRKEGLASSVDAQGHDADVSAALGQSGDAVSYGKEYTEFICSLYSNTSFCPWTTSKKQRTLTWWNMLER